MPLCSVRVLIPGGLVRPDGCVGDIPVVIGFKDTVDPCERFFIDVIFGQVAYHLVSENSPFQSWLHSEKREQDNGYEKHSGDLVRRQDGVYCSVRLSRSDERIREISSEGKASKAGFIRRTRVCSG